MLCGSSGVIGILHRVESRLRNNDPEVGEAVIRPFDKLGGDFWPDGTLSFAAIIRGVHKKESFQLAKDVVVWRQCIEDAVDAHSLFAEPHKRGERMSV